MNDTIGKQTIDMDAIVGTIQQFAVVTSSGYPGT